MDSMSEMGLATSRGIKWPFQAQRVQARAVQAATAGMANIINPGVEFSERVHGPELSLSWSAPRQSRV
jgi:hypothetical protein